MIYSCCNDNRKAAVLGNPALNGIDYLEVLDSSAPPGVPRQQTLLIHCLNPIASAMTFSPSPKTPSSAVDQCPHSGRREHHRISRSTGASRPPPSTATQPPDVLALMPVIDALTEQPNVLVVRTHEAGDFSTYCLRLVNSAAQARKTHSPSRRC